MNIIRTFKEFFQITPIEEDKLTVFQKLAIIYTVGYHVVFILGLCIWGLLDAYRDNKITGVFTLILGFIGSVVCFFIGPMLLYCASLISKYAPLFAGSMTIVQALDGKLSGLNSLNEAYLVGTGALLFGIWNVITARITAKQLDGDIIYI